MSNGFGAELVSLTPVGEAGCLSSKVKNFSEEPTQPTNKNDKPINAEEIGTASEI